VIFGIPLSQFRSIVPASLIVPFEVGIAASTWLRRRDASVFRQRSDLDLVRAG